VSLAPLAPAELDQLLNAELRQDKITAAARTSDEAFLRRVTLDLTGRLPSASDMLSFAADRDPDKRAKVIDKLLDSDAYARHWARFWRDVVTSKYTDRRQLAIVPAFERWLEDQFRANKPWNEIARAMLTADGGVQIGNPDDKKMRPVPRPPV
jgi:hypothetical protein